MCIVDKNKKKKLEKLRNAIIDEWTKKEWMDVFFFPQMNDVEGYMGTDKIFFVGSIPSYSQFPDNNGRFLYQLLNENGFKKAHLTDVVKIRSKKSKVDEIFSNKKIMKKQREYLIKEIKIINPKLIVGFGNKSYTQMEKILDQKNFQINLTKIYHYSYTRRSLENKEKFINQIKNIADQYVKN